MKLQSDELGTLLLLVAGTAEAAGCVADNCLHAMMATDRLPSAQAFCASYMAMAIAPAALPPFAAVCNEPAAVSSACSCIATEAATTKPTGSMTTVTKAPASTTPAGSASVSKPNTPSTPPGPSPTAACGTVSSLWAQQVATAVIVHGW